MSETLYIRLGDNITDPVQWLVWSFDQSEVIASGELNSAQQLNDIADKAVARKVITLVSSSAVTLKQLTIPAKSDRALRAAVPYALEDDLAEDVDKLFFAYFKKPKTDDSKHNCYTAICRHSQIQAWKTWIKDAGIYCKTMIPDVLALPYQSEQWSGIAVGGQTLLRTGLWSGVVADADWQNILFSQLNAQLEHEQTVNLYSPLDLTAYDKLAVQSQPEELPLALMAHNHDALAFNLLQGQYKVKENASPLLKGWLLAAGVAGLAIVLNMAVKGIELLQLNNDIEALDKQIVDVYTATFPDTRRVRVSTIRSQLNGKLRELGAVDSSVSFLSMMQQLQPAFSRVNQIKPKSLRFEGNRNTMRLQASGNSYQSFDLFKLELEQASLEVTPGAQNNQDNQIIGSFTIRSKS